MVSSKVFFGSINHGKIAQFASLANKLDVIIDRLDFSTLTKKDKVAVKLHLGFTDGAQTIPPFYVRRVVKRIKDTGAYPYLTDNPSAVYNAAERGYTQETCGCPIIPISGIKELYGYETEINYRNVDKMNMAGVLHDSDALVNLSHVKSQNNVGYAAALKNLGVGGYNGDARFSKIHGIFNTVPAWDSSKCTPEHALKLAESCPYGCIRYDKGRHSLSLSRGQCYNTNCMECIKADDNVGSLKMEAEGFETFQEIIAIGTKKILERYDKDKIFHINFLMDMTPTCDCMGVVQPQIIPDIGVVGSRDIVAVEQASIDLIGKEELLVDKVPPYFKHLNPDKKLHPFERLYGKLKSPYNATKYAEKHGLGTRNYELIEILPPSETINMKATHVYERGPSFA
ncbi:DUF362 domain-containing protein [Candidatus Bathyarchaeota archaeon]|nr:DUF362 domain-containing protein [Candidatus Bathyarchaeota archaeon]